MTITYVKCIDCIHIGIFVPKRGGWYHPEHQEHHDRQRVPQPNIPYCIKLNIGCELYNTHQCRHFEKWEKPTKD